MSSANRIEPGPIRLTVPSSVEFTNAPVIDLADGCMTRAGAGDSKPFVADASLVTCTAPLVGVILVSAAASVLAISHLPTHIRIPTSSIVAFCESNGKLLSELVAILAAVGLIIGGVMVTGEKQTEGEIKADK